MCDHHAGYAAAESYRIGVLCYFGYFDAGEGVADPYLGFGLIRTCVQDLGDLNGLVVAEIHAARGVPRVHVQPGRRR
jgi:hypothetical protein